VTKIVAKAYTSPSLVLLAMDWPDGEVSHDFLGFAIRRTPGFQDNKTGLFSDHSWLPNRIGFNGPPSAGQPDPPSNQAPIQKFLWWDARLDGLKPNSKLSYEISPVTGNPNSLNLIHSDSIVVDAIISEHIEFGIGTWFNRAVMSSQAFSRILNAMGIHKDQEPSPADALKLRAWLANGMERPLPDFITSASSIVGAIYHLTDALWVIPALKTSMTQSKIGLVYDAKVEKDKKTGKLKANPNEDAIKTLKDVQFFPRNKTSIMHNKFLVAGERLLSTAGEKPIQLTCGSTNYTTEGLTSQANLVHTFASDELAELYLERFQLLKKNPTKASTAKETGWSHTVSIGDAGIRVFFSPEPGRPRISDSRSIETIVEAIHAARSSVIFCLFTPTDEKLRQACFTIGDAGKMMFGIVNHIVRNEPDISPSASGSIPVDQLAALEIYHRSKDKKDVIGAEFFNAAAVPAGFEPEINIFPGAKPPGFPPVIIHHKFIVIDAETESPVIYTGSANMSGNSVFNNDENLLEIKGSPRLAHIYLAEFLRLYEHYRARARFITSQLGGASASGFELQKDRTWADKHYIPGTPEYKARLRMLAI
jgi:phosphatidylserine/phosphatidylglycerophosphate/cardiolipin synthase-like enzyme